MEKLSIEKINERLSKLEKWVLEDNYITKKFKLKGFKKAISFINKVAEIANNLNHHPDIYLENYDEVTIKLKTHSVDGITEKDFELAAKIEVLT